MDATHVVTEITYGADAFFQFTKTFSLSEEKRDISGSMKGLVKMIPNLDVGVAGNVSLSNKDKELADALEVYGIIRLNLWAASRDA